MRSILTLLLCLMVTPAYAAYTCSVSAVGGQSDGDRTKDTTAAFNSTGADLLILAAATSPSAPTSLVISDTVGGTPTGHTWTQVTTIYTAALVGVTMYYVRPSTTGASHIVVWDNVSNRDPGIAVLACAGSSDTPLDLFTGNAANSGTTLATGTATPSTDNSLVVTALGYQNTGTVSIDGSFSAPVGFNHLTSTYWGVALSYQVQTTATGVSPTWTKPNADAGTVIAVFKSSGGGAVPCTGVP